MSFEPKRIPAHSFEGFSDGTMPFEITSYNKMCSESRKLSQAKFPHRHTFYEIIYFEDGKGTHIIDFKPYPIKPPVLYFISPGQVHFWDVKQNMQCHFLFFTEDFLLPKFSNKDAAYDYSFFHNSIQSPELIFNREQQISIDEMFKTIYNEYQSFEFGRTSMIRSLLHIFLLRIQRIYNTVYYDQDDSGHDESELVRRFKKLILDSLFQQRSLKSYADQMSVSVAYLHKTVKSITGISPGQVIRQEIALEAKRLLAHTSLTTAEIGYRLGFEDPSYFGRYFKREVGIQPGYFRKHYREKYHLY